MSTSDEAVKAIARVLADPDLEGSAGYIERTLRNMGVGEAFAAGQHMRDNLTQTNSTRKWDAALKKVMGTK